MANNNNIFSTRLPEAEGVIVIDPNIIQDNGKAVARYTTPEDLMIFVELRAKLNPKSNVVIKDNNLAQTIIITKGKYYSSLKPLDAGSKDPQYLTTNWTLAYDKNRPENVEGFNINSIDIEINASLVPKIHIEFVDVRGKNLLERGDDPTNPYNIFYTFPYPLFELTVKGYYGKALRFPLIMEKAITRFDPSSGSYIISADFKSFTFAMLNDVLMLYALIVPYMYPRENTVDGQPTTEGAEIVKQKYAQLGKWLSAKYGRQVDPSEYTIPKITEMFRLNEIISQVVKDSNLSNSAERRTQVSTFLDILKGFYNELINIGANNTIDEQTRGRAVENLVNTTNQSFKTYKDKITALTPDIGTEPFNIVLNISDYYDTTKTPTVTPMSQQDYEDKRKLILNFQQQADESDVKIFREQLNSRLKFQPSVANVVLAWVVHIDAFMELLRRKTQAVVETEILANKSMFKTTDTWEYVVANTGVVYRLPWPEYYSTGQNELKYKDFPGNSPIASVREWGEVKFIDEMYAAIDRLNKDFSVDILTSNGTGGNVYVATPLSVPYNPKVMGIDDTTITNVNHILEQILAVVFHSGLLFRPVPEENKQATGTPEKSGVYPIMVNNIFAGLQTELNGTENAGRIISELQTVFSTLQSTAGLQTYASLHQNWLDETFSAAKKENHATFVEAHNYKLIDVAVAGVIFDQLKKIYLTNDNKDFKDYVFSPTKLPYNPQSLEKLDLFNFNLATDLADTNDGITSTAALSFTNNWQNNDMFVTRSY